MMLIREFVYIHNLVGKARIKSIVVQQGLTGKDYPEWRFLSSNIIACSGNATRRVMISQGVKSNSIIVTGFPALDFISHLNDEMDYGIRSEIGITVSKK